MSLLIQSLNQIPFAGLMLVVTGGFLLGRQSWRGVALGPAGGTLLVALLCGSLGVAFDDLYGVDDPTLTIGAFGFALFIYSVGFEAGPGFLSSGLSVTWRYMAVGAVVVVVATATALAGARLFDLEASVVAGLLAGALTSAGTYAAAREVANDATLLAVAFAMTYPLGLIGIVALVQGLPRLMGEDLTDLDEVEDDDEAGRAIGPELRRVFEVTSDEVSGRTVGELRLGERTGCVVVNLHRGQHFLIPNAGTRLEAQDHLMVKGRLDELRVFEEIVGPEVYDDEMRRRVPSPRAVVVTANTVVGHSLRELDLVRRFGCLVVEVERRGVALEPEADLRLERDDVVSVTGHRADVRQAANHLGRFERSSQETDIAVYAGGILLGLLLGELRFPLADSEVHVGSAVGLLAVGVVLGRYRRIGPLSAHVPVPARQLVRDLGILLFIAETGVAAGGSQWSGMRSSLWETFTVAAVALLASVLAGLFVGRRVLGIRSLDAWGSVGGGLTSSAALNQVRAAADSNEPAVSYAAAFALASVLATVAGRVVVLVAQSW